VDVQIFQAKLTIEEKTVKLTKSVAKQFPIRSGRERWDAVVKGKDVPQPLGKVAGKMLGAVGEWLFLVKDEEAGLVWVPPTSFFSALAEQVRARGNKEDNPSEVPTLIL